MVEAKPAAAAGIESKTIPSPKIKARNLRKTHSSIGCFPLRNIFRRPGREKEAKQSHTPSMPATTRIRTLVFSSFGTWGDHAPLIEIAEQFRLLKTGIDVLFLANPYFEKRITSRGFRFYPVMTVEDHLAIAGNPKLYGPGAQGLELTLPFLCRAIKPVYEWIAENTSPAETLLVINGNMIGAIVASEAKGYPVVLGDFAVTMLWNIYDPPRLPKLWILFYVCPFARALIYRGVNMLLDRKSLPLSRICGRNWGYRATYEEF